MSARMSVFCVVNSFVRKVIYDCSKFTHTILHFHLSGCHAWPWTWERQWQHPLSRHHGRTCLTGWRLRPFLAGATFFFSFSSLIIIIFLHIIYTLMMFTHSLGITWHPRDCSKTITNIIYRPISKIITAGPVPAVGQGRTFLAYAPVNIGLVVFIFLNHDARPARWWGPGWG